MRGIGAIAIREFSSFFRTPLGWVVVALFLALSGLVFSQRVLIPGEQASMRAFVTVWWGLLMVLAPAISMRLVSEELRTGTIEPLLTSPVSEAAVVIGKYLGAVMFLVAMLAPTLLYALLLMVLSHPDPGPILSGYLGVLLLGLLYLAVGTLASVLTSSQTLAFLATLFVLMAFDLLVVIAGGALPERVARVVYEISPNLRVADFAKGVIDTANVGFFVIASLWFLAIATLVLQSRRWR